VNVDGGIDNEGVGDGRSPGVKKKKTAGKALHEVCRVVAVSALLLRRHHWPLVEPVVTATVLAVEGFGADYLKAERQRDG